MLLEGWVEWCIAWAYTPYGVLALFITAFVESSFFPIPPDILLIALSALHPQWGLGYAAVCTVGSVFGGVFGYLIGQKGGRPLLRRLISEERIRWAEVYYQKYDVWAVGIAGFTPLPYKVFTISAGMFSLDLTRFVLVSLMSRGARFFLVGSILFFFGEMVKSYLTEYFDIFTIGVMILLILGFFAVRLISKRMHIVKETSNPEE